MSVISRNVEAGSSGGGASSYAAASSTVSEVSLKSRSSHSSDAVTCSGISCFASLTGAKMKACVSISGSGCTPSGAAVTGCERSARSNAVASFVPASGARDGDDNGEVSAVVSCIETNSIDGICSSSVCAGCSRYSSGAMVMTGVSSVDISLKSSGSRTSICCPATSRTSSCCSLRFGSASSSNGAGSV